MIVNDYAQRLGGKQAHDKHLGCITGDSNKAVNCLHQPHIPQCGSARNSYQHTLSAADWTTISCVKEHPDGPDAAAIQMHTLTALIMARLSSACPLEHAELLVLFAWQSQSADQFCMAHVDMHNYTRPPQLIYLYAALPGSIVSNAWPPVASDATFCVQAKYRHTVVHKLPSRWQPSQAFKLSPASHRRKECLEPAAGPPAL